MHLIRALDARRMVKRLTGFPDSKARLLAALLRLSPTLFHRLLHKT